MSTPTSVLLMFFVGGCVSSMSASPVEPVKAVPMANSPSDPGGIAAPVAPPNEAPPGPGVADSAPAAEGRPDAVAPQADAKPAPRSAPNGGTADATPSIAPTPASEAVPQAGPPPAATATSTTAPAAPAAPSVPTQWSLTASNSKVVVVSRIDASSLFASLGHDHAIGASKFTGDVTWGDGVSCAVDIVVPARDLKVDPPGSRKLAGIDPSVDMSADDKASIEANFKGKKQLDIERFPDIRFKSRSCSGTSGNVSVTGDFTMHGVTKSVTLPLKVSVDGQAFRASGKFSIKGSDYGMPPFVAPLGALRNLDQLDFVVDVVGAPK
jgi:hypothetical protein